MLLTAWIVVYKTPLLVDIISLCDLNEPNLGLINCLVVSLCGVTVCVCLCS